MEILVDLNNQFLEDFEDRLKKWPTITHFGDLFIKIIPIMKIYSHYIRNYDRAAELLATLKKENETLQEFIKIQETKPIMGNLTLESHLIMPVQRLPRYQLLLDTLLKYTPEEHVDHQNLIKALEKTREVINTINQKKKKDDINLLALSTFHMKYPEIALEKSITQLVHESNLILHTGKKSKMHHCTLFENMFIQLVVRKKLLILNESTKEISRTHVKTVRIKDLDDTNELKNAFNLVITTLSGNEVIFLCSSDDPAVKSGWFSSVTKAFK